MVISSTSAVLASIQAVSPESSLGGASSASAGIATNKSGSSAPSPQVRRGRFIVRVSLICSECRGIGLAGANSYGAFDVEHEYLAVADFTRVCRLGDRLDHLVAEFGWYHDLDLHLRQEIHMIFCATVDLSLSLLSAKSLHFRDRETLYAEWRKCLADIVKLEGLDDGHDQLHVAAP